MALFSIATTPRCRGGCYSFPGLIHFTLDAYLIMLSVKRWMIGTDGKEKSRNSMLSTQVDDDDDRYN